MALTLPSPIVEVLILPTLYGPLKPSGDSIALLDLQRPSMSSEVLTCQCAESRLTVEDDEMQLTRNMPLRPTTSAAPAYYASEARA